MRITANKIFKFNGHKYNAVREYGQLHKYRVMRYSEFYEAWILDFKADSLREVLEILENSENL